MLRRLVSTVVLLALFVPVLAAAQVHVDGYYRRDGTYVQPHWRSLPPRGLDHTIPLQAGRGVTPVDPYAFQRGMLLGQDIRLRQQEIQLRQMEIDRLQRR